MGQARGSGIVAVEAEWAVADSASQNAPEATFLGIIHAKVSEPVKCFPLFDYSRRECGAGYIKSMGVQRANAD